MNSYILHRKALGLYNSSIAFASPGSDQLGLAFANRSAVHMDMKNYEAAVKDVKLAFENGVPKKGVIQGRNLINMCQQ